MAKKIAYIHIGTHKTASTYLQKFLLRNRRQLLKNGIFLPKLYASGDRGKAHNNHKIIATALKKVENLQSMQVFDNLRKEIRKYPEKNVLLTSEIFEDRLQKKNVEFLQGFFSSLGFEVVFIAYIRNQPEYINSRYTQTIKRFWDDCSFETYIRQSQSNKFFDYNQLFSNILYNPSVSFIARPFDLAVEKGIEDDFLDILFGQDSYERSIFSGGQKEQNPAPGPLTIFTGRVTRKVLLNTYPSEKSLTDFGKYLVRRGKKYKWNETKFVGLTNETARSIESLFKKGNNEFANKVWGQNWNNYFSEKEFSQNTFHLRRASPKELKQINATISEILSIAHERRTGRTPFRYLPLNLRQHFDADVSFEKYFDQIQE